MAIHTEISLKCVHYSSLSPHKTAKFYEIFSHSLPWHNPRLKVFSSLSEQILTYVDSFWQCVMAPVHCYISATTRGLDRKMAVSTEHQHCKKMPCYIKFCLVVWISLTLSNNIILLCWTIPIANSRKLHWC